jgi:hypothetical protein
MKRIGTYSALGALLAVVACGDDVTGVDRGGDAVVVGRIEATVTTPDAGGGQTAPAPTATSVALVEVSAQGSVQILATAAVRADGSFAITEAPAGRDHLVVEARSASGAVVGRSIVHTRTRSNASVTVAPIDARTTVEAAIYAELRRRGRSTASIATPLIAGHIELASNAEARAVASSSAELEALATAFERLEAAYLQALVHAGATVDAPLLQAAGAEVAASAAALLHLGTDRAEVRRHFLSGLARAYAQAGVAVEAQATAASAAAAVILDLRAETRANLAVLRGIAHAMVAARTELATRGLERAGAGAQHAGIVTAASLEAAVRLDNAATAASIAAALELFAAEIRAALSQTAAASAAFGHGAYLALNAALATADLDARLEARLRTATSTQAIVQAYIEYFAELRTVAVAALTGAGTGQAAADALAEVVIASRTGIAAAL